MFVISVKHDLDAFARSIERLRRDQLPFAIARALTDTAKAAKDHVTAELPHIFDRPNPFTMRSLTYIPARKDRLFAVVTVKDIQAKYLLPEEIGGERTAASNTRKVAKALVEPGPTLPRDQFGGIPVGALAQIRKAAVAHGKKPTGAPDRKAKRRARRKLEKFGPPTLRQHVAAIASSGVFYLPPNRSHGWGGGYFRRLPDRHITRLIAFVGAAHYHPRFRFQQHVGDACAKAFLPAMQRRYAEAVASALAR